MTHTARNSVVAKRIQTLLLDKVGDATFFDPPIQNVFYGDQQKIPSVPTLCVEPATKTRQWPPTPTDMTQNELSVIIYVYFVNENPDFGIEASRYLVDRLSETVEEYLNINFRQLPDASGNALVIYSAVVENESGMQYKGNSPYQAARLVWRGITKTSLRAAQ